MVNSLWLRVILPFLHSILGTCPLMVGKRVNLFQLFFSNLLLSSQAFQYSAEKKQPLLAFCGDQIVSLFEHHLTEQLHTVYMEPKV